MKQNILKIVNPVLFGAVALQAVTVLSMRFFPSSIEWAYPLHIADGYAVTGIILVHLGLNFPWIKSTYFRPKKTS